MSEARAEYLRSVGATLTKGPDVTIHISCVRCQYRNAVTCTHPTVRVTRSNFNRQISVNLTTPEWCPEREDAIGRAMLQAIGQPVLQMEDESPPQTP